MNTAPNPLHDPDGYLRAVSGTVREAAALDRLAADMMKARPLTHDDGYKIGQLLCAPEPEQPETCDRCDTEPCMCRYVCSCGWRGDRAETVMTHPGCNNPNYPSPPDYAEVCPDCGQEVEEQ